MLAILSPFLSEGTASRWRMTPAFGARGSSHPRLNSLNDQIPLQLRNRANDNDNSPSQRTAGVDIFAQADEFDSQVVSSSRTSRK